MRIVIIISCLIFSTILDAIDIQGWNYDSITSSYNTNDPQLLEIQHLNSDFGKRYFNGGSASNPDWIYGWHKGLDFLWTESNLVLAPFDATVIDIHNSYNGAKWIAIENNDANDDTKLGFLHCFSTTSAQAPNTSCNSGYAFFCNTSDPNLYCIIIVNPNDTSERMAYAEVAGLSVSFTYNNEPNPTTLITTNIIDENDPFVPIGNSGGNTHLHLSYFRSNQFPLYSDVNNHMDPLTIIDVYDQNNSEYTNTNDYDIDLLYTERFSDSTSTIRVRTNLLNPTGNDASLTPNNDGFSDAIMCIDRLELLIAPSHLCIQESEMIKGDTLKAYINHRAREEERSFNPHNIHDDQPGDIIRTGIDPYAYRSVGGQIYDDYYFADFYTRIHEDDYLTVTPVRLADVNQSARYPDNKYRIYGYYETVYEPVTAVDSIRCYVEAVENIEILIDNFVPYIKEVKIYSNGSTAYWAGWHWWESTGLVYSEQVDSPIRAENDITIKVTTSEPMDTLRISSIQPLNWQPQQHENVNNDRTEWTFRIPASNIPLNTHDGVHTITFEGADLAENSLQLMQKENSPFVPGSIPKRQSETAFAPLATPGPDSNHYFEVISSTAGIINNSIVNAIQTDAGLEPIYEQGSAYILEDVNSLHEGFNFVESGYTVSVDNEVVTIEPGTNFTSEIYVSCITNVDTLLVWNPQYDMSFTKANTLSKMVKYWHK